MSDFFGEASDGSYSGMPIEAGKEGRYVRSWDVAADIFPEILRRNR